MSDSFDQTGKLGFGEYSILNPLDSGEAEPNAVEKEGIEIFNNTYSGSFTGETLHADFKDPFIEIAYRAPNAVVDAIHNNFSTAITMIESHFGWVLSEPPSSLTVRITDAREFYDDMGRPYEGGRQFKQPWAWVLSENTEEIKVNAKHPGWWHFPNDQTGSAKGNDDDGMLTDPLHVAIHEVLHSLAEESHKFFEGDGINPIISATKLTFKDTVLTEGVTELYTQRVMNAHGYDSTPGFGHALKLAEELEQRVGEHTLLQAYFKVDEAAAEKVSAALMQMDREMEEIINKLVMEHLPDDLATVSINNDQAIKAIVAGLRLFNDRPEHVNFSPTYSQLEMFRSVVDTIPRRNLERFGSIPDSVLEAYIRQLLLDRSAGG